MTKNHPLCSRLLACSLLVVAACSQTPQTNGVPTAASHARLAVEIVDAPAPKYSEVVVTIAKITAHSTSAGWVTISDTPATLDLLKLKDVGFVFGKVELAPDKITQIRLYTDPLGPHFVTLPDGSHVDLKVPSGPQSGIKVTGPVDLAACEETTLTLDFDPAKSISVHPTGNGDLWILRPVIKAKKIVSSAVGCATPDVDGGTDVIDPPALPDGSLPTGSPCTVSSDCLSGFCGDSICGVGAPGTPCLTAADCASAICAEGVCGIGPAVGAGQPCTDSAACLSGVCTSGACEAGAQGTPCLLTEDCLAGLTCLTGTCSPQLN
ncbi:MAG TPA: DUF4382 domain-containing protein [Myxococcales bacterium]|jgi:hypothetical protein